MLRKRLGVQSTPTFQIPILADFTKQTTKAFGVLEPELGVSFRALFIVDPNGQIRHSLVNDLPVGRSVDEALRTLKAFQFHEKHGEGKWNVFGKDHFGF